MSKPFKQPVTLAAVITIALLSATSTAGETSEQRGKLKSPSCQFCHIPVTNNTMSDNQSGASDPSYPSLNGQDKTYLVSAMSAYQSGERTGGLAKMMRAQLQKLNSDDLKDIAAYYSSLTN